MNKFIYLALVFQLKHFIADFPLQAPYMLRKNEQRWMYFLPLLSHCLVHGVLTLVICLIVNPSLWWLAVVDTLTHFIIDRVKASPRYLGRFTMKQPLIFWSIFGLDQMLHHVIGIWIALFLIN